MSSESIVCMKDNHTSWGIGPSRIGLDAESMGFVDRIIKKYGKSSRWLPVVSYPKRDFIQRSDALKSFLDETRKGLGVPMIANKHKVVVGTISRNEEGTFKFSPVDSELFDETEEEIPEEISDEVISDPESPAALKLVGERVLVSATKGFKEHHLMVLSDIDIDDRDCFKGTDAYGNLIGGSYIKRYVETLRPLDLSDPLVRDTLRGVWLREKKSGYEMFIGKFWEDNGTWKANRVDAVSLFKDWEFLDGSVIGVEA